jgi:threonine-phosphate decarboxylase
MLHGHGGNISAVARRFGLKPSEIIDMSSNINPLGPPEGLMDFLKDNLMSLTALPEVDSRQAGLEYSAYLDIDPERVLAGNGTTQFIYALPRVLNSQNALIMGPTYSDYGDSCVLQGIGDCYHFAEESSDFEHSTNKIKARLDGVDTVFICNPNNPTGSHMPVNELQYLCKTHPQTTFIIDESYLPFIIGAETESMVNSGLENVIVLASLSKIFKIPGLRIGFVIADPKILKSIRQRLLPWSVNSLAQAAVRFVNRQKKHTQAFVQKSRLYFEDQRKLFDQYLKEISGLRLYPSQAPYILIRLPAATTSGDVWTHFMKEKILIRDCSNFSGLTDRYIRISLKTPEANKMAARKLRSFALQATSDSETTSVSETTSDRRTPPERQVA